MTLLFLQFYIEKKTYIETILLGQCHEKSMPFHHVRCCFGSIEWSANWRYIFAIFLYKNRLTDCLHFAPLRIQIGVRWCPSTIHYYLR